MSLMTEAIIAEKYGMRLSIEKLSEVMGLARNTIYNQVAQGVFQVPTYVDGGKRWADYRDVATYFDACRARAAAETSINDRAGSRA